jgi:hypothetical protein
MFAICSFNSPDLDGYQGTRENKNVPRETHKGSRNPTIITDAPLEIRPIDSDTPHWLLFIRVKFFPFASTVEVRLGKGEQHNNRNLDSFTTEDSLALSLFCPAKDLSICCQEEAKRALVS